MGNPLVLLEYFCDVKNCCVISLVALVVPGVGGSWLNDDIEHWAMTSVITCCFPDSHIIWFTEGAVSFEKGDGRLWKSKGLL